MISKYYKFVVSAVWLILAIVGMFVFVSPDFKNAVIALLPAALGVITVFGTKNATPDAIDKAIMQLFTAGTSVALFWTTIPATTITNVGVLVAAFASAYTVWRVSNSGTTIAPTTAN